MSTTLTRLQGRIKQVPNLALLARTAKCSRNTLYNILAGAHDPNSATAEAIEAAVTKLLTPPKRRRG